MDQVEDIKNKTDIVQLVSEYVKLTKAGRNYKGLCPFHSEKTPSFMVNPELQIYKCFGCGEGGDAYAFLQKMEGMEFGEALRSLAEKAGVKLVSYKPSAGEEAREKLYEINHLAAEYYHYLLVKHSIGEPARKYLKQRKISQKATETFRLGYVPEGWDFLIKYLVEKKGFHPEDLVRAGMVIRKGEGNYYDRFRNRVMFPLTNHRGQTVGFAGRVLPASADAAGGQARGQLKSEQAKYVNTPETEIYHKGDLLYGLDVNKAAIKKSESAVVVEGEIDAIASWQAGVENVVAIKGSALTQRQVEIMKRYTQAIVLSLDADLAGDMAARRGIETAEKAGMIIKVTNPKSQIPGYKYKDPGEAAAEDPTIWKRVVEGAVPIYDYYLDSAIERYGLEAVGKKKISQELVPIWAKIDDEIMKSHYVNKLADKLGVEAQAVWTQIGKVLNAVAGKGQTPDKEEREMINRTRKEIVEEEVLRQALLGEKMKDLVKNPIKKWITDEFWKRVIKEYAGGATVESLPAELKARVADLLLTEWEFSEVIWEQLLRELEKEYLKSERAKLDPSKDLEEIRKLDQRYNELTKSL